MSVSTPTHRVMTQLIAADDGQEQLATQPGRVADAAEHDGRGERRRRPARSARSSGAARAARRPDRRARRSGSVGSGRRSVTACVPCQVAGHQVAGDRRGRFGTRPPCSTSDRDRDGRRIGRREPDEPRVRLALAAQLGGPGLAGGRDAGDLRPGRELPAELALDRLRASRRGSPAASAGRVTVDSRSGLDRAACRRRPVIAVTRCGFISTPPLAIVAATSAICSGVTNVSPWP